MKWYTYIIWTLFAAAAWPLAAAPVPASADTNAPIKSVFLLPSNPNEGRDPFFPNSTRPYEDIISKHAVDVTSLEIKGFSEIAGCVVTSSSTTTHLPKVMKVM